MEAKDYSIMHCKDGNLYINRNRWTEFRSDDSKCFSEEDLESIKSWIKQNNEYVRKNAFIEKAEKFFTEKFEVEDYNDNIDIDGSPIFNYGRFIEDFRKYMEGE